ncbi:MAG: hypothetical protein HY518_03550 [Candidatus Aenigmarchaeota archaeon]|nr:hypothetical protein [Candidatus Aenigmarchaeota archaeon]
MEEIRIKLRSGGHINNYIFAGMQYMAMLHCDESSVYHSGDGVLVVKAKNIPAEYRSRISPGWCEVIACI